GNIQIKRVITPADRRKFLLFPWQIYKPDPLWVPPLLPERKDVINPEKGVFFDRGEAEFFLAFKDGKLAGTVCAAEDPPTNQNRRKKECMFGFLEYIEDFDVFQALIDQVKNWGKERNLDSLYGPWNLDYEDSYGVLIEGRDTPPALMCGHTPPYYQEFMKRSGFLPARDQNVALRISLEDSLQIRRLFRLADRVKKQGKISIRSADFNRWQEEIDIVQMLLGKALAHLDDSIGWHREALEATLEPFKTIADPNLILFAVVEGETVGFLPGLPNLNEIFIDVNGLRYPWNYLKLLWLMKRRDPIWITAKSVLVLPEYWNRGVVVLLMEEFTIRAREQGYLWVDMSITSADNPTSVLTAEKMGAEIYKRWQVYQLPINSS
ncbi:MAG: GNAT family N-acetyltransferase, partial [Anaerolineales bacterium]|nr:GNAT family N-acetyltransferase [Anaerolineales bacterium]